MYLGGGKAPPRTNPAGGGIFSSGFYSKLSRAHGTLCGVGTFGVPVKTEPFCCTSPWHE